jgi:hypothetical protein
MMKCLKIKSESVKLRSGLIACSKRKAVAKMKWFKILLLTALVAGIGSQSYAYEYYEGSENVPELEIWVNKGPSSTYYYGEDIAVFMEARQDCYVVVYDIDPSGEVTILYPSGPFGSTYVTAGNIYRIPDYDDDFALEVSGNSGTDHIFAVASYSYINPPDFMRYIGYEYGDPNYYDDSYFVMTVRGDIDDFVDYTNRRLVRGPYSVSHVKFFVNSGYRHHSHYRYWNYDPYYVGSVWVGSNWPGAEIWIDGVYYGIAPVLIPSIYIGHHWVWVYYGGYPCYQRYFYVGGYNRYYINVTIESRFKDRRHRRHAFRDWRFHERRHRNEDGFREKAVRARQNKVRTRSIPSSMVLNLHEKGAIRENSPILKNARAGVRSRTERNVENRARVKDSDRDKRSDREVKVEKRTQKEAENRVKSRKTTDFDRSAKSKYYIKDDGREKRSDKSSKSTVKEKKSSNKSSKSSIKESKKSKKAKSTSKKSKSSYKKSDKKSSKSSGSKSSSDKSKRSVKSSKSSKKSDSDRGKRKW